MLVLSHRDPAQVNRLTTRLLQGPQTRVLVHHDPRGPALRLPHHERVLTVPDAGPCDWGRPNLAMAVFAGLRSAVQQVPDLEWVLVVSGQDYPCLPMPTIEAELAASSLDATLRWFRADADPSQDVHPWQASTRRRYLRRLRVPGSHRSMPFPRRHPFGQGTNLYVGDMWPNLRRPAVDHLLAQLESRRDLVRYFRRAPVPDEGLLPTLLLNDAQLAVGNERRRFIRWVHGEPHPKTLDLADLSDIRASGDWFARKVDPQHSAALLDSLDSLDALQDTSTTVD